MVVFWAAIKEPHIRLGPTKPLLAETQLSASIYHPNIINSFQFNQFQRYADRPKQTLSPLSREATVQSIYKTKSLKIVLIRQPMRRDSVKSDAIKT